jgi:hypothetical protein
VRNQIHHLFESVAISTKVQDLGREKPDFPFRNVVKQAGTRFAYKGKGVPIVDTILCHERSLVQVGRAVPWPPSFANERVLIYHDGAHGVTRPTFTRRRFSRQPGKLCQC